MMKMTFAFLTLAAVTPAHADKIDDALKQAEQESEAARAIINKNPNAGRGAICAPDVDTSKACFDAQSFTKDQGARYQAAQVKLILLKKIAELDDTEKQALKQLLNDQEFISLFPRFNSIGIQIGNSLEGYFDCPSFVLNDGYKSIFSVSSRQHHCSIAFSSFRLIQLLVDSVANPYNGYSFFYYVTQSPENKKFILDLLQ